jgi:hypothetical protein|tara:strand:+ start:285 stop:404 length:120 start_codon:yes stop_codon:yes gene_type:complete
MDKKEDEKLTREHIAGLVDLFFHALLFCIGLGTGYFIWG